MAGICTTGGLTTTPDGKIAIAGFRAGAWPYACSIVGANGLRVDPVTGNAWVAPPAESLVDTAQGPNKSIVPTASGVIQSLVTEQTVPNCGKARWFCWILGGHAGWRQASGNFWAITRTVTVKIDGVVVGFSGDEQVSVAENNSGGAISSGSAVESTMIHDMLNPGQVVRVEAVYTQQVYSLTPNAVNSLGWRSPKITSVLWRPHP